VTRPLLGSGAVDEQVVSGGFLVEFAWSQHLLYVVTLRDVQEISQKLTSLL
jgi:hypothetical protein